MKKEEILSRVKRLISPIIEAEGIELIEIQYNPRGGRSTLRLFIDKDGGVSIEDCERISREVEAYLDVEDIIPGSYTLEVSSPGLDRPLRRIEDYRRNIGKLIRLSTSSPIMNQRFFKGRIAGLKEESVRLSLERGKEVSIPFSEISKANLEIEF